MLMKQPTALHTCLSIFLDGDVLSILPTFCIWAHMMHDVRLPLCAMRKYDWPPYTKTLHCRMARAKRRLHRLLYETRLYVSKMQSC